MSVHSKVISDKQNEKINTSLFLNPLSTQLCTAIPNEVLVTDSQSNLRTEVSKSSFRAKLSWSSVSQQFYSMSVHSKVILDKQTKTIYFVIV